jgi:hypothetical protein
MASEGAASRKKARRRNDQQANAPAQVVQQESAEGATNACETGNEQTQLQGLEQHDGGLQADQPNVAAASSKGTWISSKKPYLSFPGRIVVASTAVEITEACSTFMGLVAALKNPSSKLILGFDMEVCASHCCRWMLGHSDSHSIAQIQMQEHMHLSSRFQAGVRTQRHLCGEHH